MRVEGWGLRVEDFFSAALGGSRWRTFSITNYAPPATSNELFRSIRTSRSPLSGARPRCARPGKCFFCGWIETVHFRWLMAVHSATATPHGGGSQNRVDTQVSLNGSRRQFPPRAVSDGDMHTQLYKCSVFSGEIDACLVALRQHWASHTAGSIFRVHTY